MALRRIIRGNLYSVIRVVNYRLFSEDEVSRAASATFSKTPSTTVFSRILNKELPADIVYEDDKVL